MALAGPIELVLCLAQVYWYRQHLQQFSPWPGLAHAIWLLLSGTRFVTACLLILCMKLFMDITTGTSCSELHNYRSLTAEYLVLHFGAILKMMHAVQLMVNPVVRTHYSFIDAGIVLCLLLETLRQTWIQLFSDNFVTPSLKQLLLWNTGDIKERTAMLCREQILGRSMLDDSLEQLCGEPLLNIHAIQSGELDKKDQLIIPGAFGTSQMKAVNDSIAVSDGPFGSQHPKVCQVLIRAENYSAIEACDFPDLTQDDLKLFHANLSKVLRACPLADVIHIPCGSHFKKGRLLPFLHLSFSDYAKAIQDISGQVTANTLVPTACADELAIDVSSVVLGDPRTNFLKEKSFVEMIESGPCKEFYDVAFSFMPELRPQVADHRAHIHVGIVRPSPGSYELQVRGLFSARPIIALRLLKSDLGKLPEAVAALPRIDVFPTKKRKPSDAAAAEKTDSNQAFTPRRVSQKRKN